MLAQHSAACSAHHVYEDSHGGVCNAPAGQGGQEDRLVSTHRRVTRDSTEPGAQTCDRSCRIRDGRHLESSVLDRWASLAIDGDADHYSNSILEYRSNATGFKTNFSAHASEPRATCALRRPVGWQMGTGRSLRATDHGRLNFLAHQVVVEPLLLRTSLPQRAQRN